MKVTVAKVHENLFNGDALSVMVKTTEGDMTILPKHEAFVANLVHGIIGVKTSVGEQKFEIEGGVLEVSNDQVTILL